MNLYPHNQKAYEAVITAFDNGQRRAAVVHATGTGKSYIIGAVVQHHQNTLVLAPREFILGEVRNVCSMMFPMEDGCHKVTFATYSSLLFTEEFKKNYDLIVLDEFHHTGAKQWGRKIIKLLDANPEAHVLGTSATPMRHSDHNRNMVDELFNGSVVSHLPLEKAIGDILPIPTYVRSIWDFDKSEQIIIDSLLASRRTNEWKHDKVELVRRQCLDWKQSKGVPQILAKYLKPEMRHIILFAPSVKEGRRMQAMMSLWMHKAGFEDIEFFEINSKVTGVGKVLADYKTDNGHTIHIAIAINMLNEGVHIPGVDCIIMLRNTRSQTIIEQQLGRVLTASSDKQPLVLDFVNNISLVYSFKRAVHKPTDDSLEYTPLFNKESTIKFTSPKLPFKVIDESADLGEFIASISRQMHDRTFEDCLESARRYETRNAWSKSEPASYYYAKRYGWLKKCCEHMHTGYSIHTKQECIDDATLYRSFKEWDRNSHHLVEYARRKGWLNMCTAQMERLWDTHTKQECIESALKFTSRYKWQKSKTDGKFYQWALVHGYLEECCKHMTNRGHTKDECIQSAQKYKRRGDWFKAEQRFYSFAKKHGIFDECVAHME